MTESWRDDQGVLKERKNRVIVEAVGRHSAMVSKRAKLGSWVTLEGYIRSEQFKGQDLLKVRTLSITIWGDTNEKLPDAGDDGNA